MNLNNIRVILKVYLLSIIIFTIFRLILFISALDKLGNSYQWTDILLSFLMGLRFDIVISSYLLILPFFLLTANLLYNRFNKVLSKILFFLIFISFSIAFLVCAADIPYFHQFFSRFTISAFEWMNTPLFVLKMIVQEPSYWLYIIPFAFAIYIFYKSLKKIIYNKLGNSKKPKYIIEFIISFFFFLLIILGIRGRTETKSPIRVGTAYFCNNPLLNKLGLNPNFTLIRSYLDSKIDYNQPIHLMDNQVAIDNIRKYLNIIGNDTLNPLLRYEKSDTSLINGKRPNIVLVLMESMSAGKMKRHGDKNNLTPFLDSLSKEGFYFENTYSAGIHTYNGIFSTLFSFPAIFKKHSMKNTPIPEYNGIANTLDNLNYSTIFFMTHDGQFDNVEGFLMANGFDRVISQKDYPSEEIKTALGVPDDYLFRFSIPILNKLNEKDKPFFAAFMTASDHGPRYIPDYFKPHSSNKEHQSVEYADYSLHKFIEIAKKQKWFDNTLFVFIADHGAPIDATYDLSLDYNHVPLLFYAPKMIKENKVFSQMAGQIDVYPSIMGLLGLPFENNTLGINLFKYERPYIYFNVDDKYGVIDKDWLLIVKNNGKSGLYKYQNQDLKNYIEEQPRLSAEMKKYAESNIQSYQYILSSKKTKIKQ